MNKIGKIEKLLIEGLDDGVYPGTELIVGNRGEIVFSKQVGYCSFIPKKIPIRENVLFDLASLTKPLATTTALMRLIDKGRLGLDQGLSDLLGETVPDDKRDLTLRLLLSHSAGFPDWKPFYKELIRYDMGERKTRLINWTLKEPLVYIPGESSVYSDLGFMLLDKIIECASGVSMDAFLESEVFEPLNLGRLYLSGTQKSKRFEKEMFAATEDCPWRRRIIRGEVHDENAYALGGYSGHAGLFGSANDVYVLANLLRSHFRGEREDYFKTETVKLFFSPQERFGDAPRTLGWDMPSPENSSTGKYFSQNSVGHLGFTGTSLWMDLEKDVLVIFLTNRIHPTRNNEKIKAFRPQLHNAIMEELGFTQNWNTRE